MFEGFNISPWALASIPTRVAESILLRNPHSDDGQLPGLPAW